MLATKILFSPTDDGRYRLGGHKKRKDSMETRAVLLIFLLELKISGVAVQEIH